MRYDVWEWRRLDHEAPRVTCQHTGCTRRAVWCLTWRTATMPACAFEYFCDDHKEDVDRGDRIHPAQEREGFGDPSSPHARTALKNPSSWGDNYWPGGRRVKAGREEGQCTFGRHTRR
jgi:hypothetical protein